MTNLQKGLVGHWTMDDADTSGGTLYDRSAYDNHANLNGGVTTGISAQVGEAYSFDGTDDYIDPTISETSGSFTITGWVNIQGISQVGATGYATIIGSGNENRLLIDDSDGRALAQIDGFDITSTVSGSNVTPGVGSFNFYAFVYDSIAGEAYWQINSTTCDPISCTITFNDATIGSYNLSDYMMNGQIDDVRLYNRVLSDSEISALYNMRSQRQIESDLQKGLVGHWTLDTDATSNGITYDSSAQDNHGTISGSVTTGVSAIVDEGYKFDGTQGGVELHNPNVSSHSLSCWFNSDTLDYAGAGDSPVIFGAYNAGSIKYTLITPENGNIKFAIDDGSNSYTQISSTNMNTNEWYHAVLTYDAPTGITKSYVNSIEQGSISYTSEIIFDNATYRFGENVYHGSYFDGIIDDGRIYNRVLSENEVKRLYNKR